uniref:ATP synthase complex subunit 8 n=1 Tax=Scolytinae sp. BMNH 1040002 TaxID=1903775 RepID=A0A343A5V3_9CUCU|nr:ATP synthase F0 subunit 8 [Scolytinae sp. BMNH 1040002]
MPQMAPMSWMTLYLVFSIILMITMAISFFQILYTKKTSSKKKIKTQMNWKW